MFEAVSLFLETGGNVLWVILFMTILLWSLIVERFIYLRFSFTDWAKPQVAEWSQRREFSSWSAHRIREAVVSQADMELKQHIPLIKTIVALCPLMGLLGTVTGMISVFDVMGAVGTGNTRSMASGISMATIPTMAGMVASLSGIYFGNMLEKKVELRLATFEDQLPIQ